MGILCWNTIDKIQIPYFLEQNATALQGFLGTLACDPLVQRYEATLAFRLLVHHMQYFSKMPYAQLVAGYTFVAYVYFQRCPSLA